MHKAIDGLNRLGFLAPLVLRVVVGGLFLWHGIDKFDIGLSSVEDFFASLDVPAPAVTAPLVAVVEVVAGAALILGVLTRLGALLFCVEMIGAIIFVKADVGVLSRTEAGAELDLALLAGAIAILLMGPGPVSVDSAIGIEPSSEKPASPDQVLAES